MDLRARKVVGWSRKPTLAREQVLDALLMALWRRKPQGVSSSIQTKGPQYGSDDWRRFCHSNNLEPSMSRRGNCWDNAVAEFLQQPEERTRAPTHIQTRDLARADIFDYIGVFYNRTRRHTAISAASAPRHLSMPQFEAQVRPRYRGKSSLREN